MSDTASRCPSELALEAHLIQPERSALAPHFGACPACQARLARMEREGEDFRRYVFPKTVEKVENALARPRRRLALLLAPLGGLAALATALLVVLRPVGPDADYVGLKGADMGLAVYVAADSGVKAVADGSAVPASAALRFRLRPAPGCRLWIVSVDAAGQVSRLYPAGGDAPPVAEEGAVPGGALLDGTAGPERIFAVCASEPLPYATVERAAQASASGGAEKVRAAKLLPGLPPGASQATLLLEKQP